jgi:predicted metal-dependent HD superfamily phosphohydrolase
MTLSKALPGYRQHSALEFLEQAYQEPGRHYHTWDHISNMIERLIALETPKEWERRLLTAAFYHDAVYDVKRNDNEERSLLACLDDMGAMMPLDVQALSAYILSTKNHKPYMVDYCTEFLNADLEILASPPEEYGRYVANLRKEYSCYSEKDWIRGRSNFLIRYLGELAIAVSHGEEVVKKETLDSWATLSKELEMLQASASQ